MAGAGLEDETGEVRRFRFPRAAARRPIDLARRHVHADLLDEDFERRPIELPLLPARDRGPEENGAARRQRHFLGRSSHR